MRAKLVKNIRKYEFYWKNDLTKNYLGYKLYTKWLKRAKMVKNHAVFRGIFVGFKSIILFYIYLIITYTVSNIPILILFIFGLLNGFIDGIVISKKIQQNIK
jgi:hypothetical protein